MPRPAFDRGLPPSVSWRRRKAVASGGGVGVPATVVVGLQFGDEGKGKITDYLAARMDMVVRSQGGANAGHTVIVGGERFALHQVPSGILTPGVQCVIANGVVLDPEALLGELEELAGRGVDIGRVW